MLQKHSQSLSSSHSTHQTWLSCFDFVAYFHISQEASPWQKAAEREERIMEDEMTMFVIYNCLFSSYFCSSSPLKFQFVVESLFCLSRVVVFVDEGAQNNQNGNENKSKRIKIEFLSLSPSVSLFVSLLPNNCVSSAWRRARKKHYNCRWMDGWIDCRNRWDVERILEALLLISLDFGFMLFWYASAKLRLSNKSLVEIDLCDLLRLSSTVLIVVVVCCCCLVCVSEPRILVSPGCTMLAA